MTSTSEAKASAPSGIRGRRAPSSIVAPARSFRHDKLKRAPADDREEQVVEREEPEVPARRVGAVGASVAHAPGRYLEFLALYDPLFAVVCWGSFEFVVSE